MLYIYNNPIAKCVVCVEKLAIGEKVYLYKKISGAPLSHWVLSLPELYRELTNEEKLKLL